MGQSTHILTSNKLLSSTLVQISSQKSPRWFDCHKRPPAISNHTKPLHFGWSLIMRGLAAVTMLYKINDHYLSIQISKESIKLKHFFKKRQKQKYLMQFSGSFVQSMLQRNLSQSIHPTKMKITS